MVCLRAFASALFAIPLVALNQTPAPNLLQVATDPNPALHSYIASASLSAELRAAVPVHKTFTGSAYYLSPNEKIVFDNVSGPLSKFSQLTTVIPTYGELKAGYTISPIADDGRSSTYLLVPSTPGRRVKDVTLSVDDRAALVVRAVWTYTNGGRLTFDQTYASVGGFQLPVSEIITARFPGYSVDGTLQLSNYRLNAPVPPSVFAEKP